MMTQLTGTGQLYVREAVPSSDTVRERFAVIDGLRAFAIVAVLVYEAFALVPAIAGGRLPLARALGDASQGFTLFLLLSGFTLAYPAIVALDENGRAYLDIARFAIKRVLRIYPAYLLALLLAIAIPPIALRYGLPALGGPWHRADLEIFIRNAVFAGDGLGNAGFAALAIIARLYVLFPLLLLLWSRSGRIFAAVLALSAVLDTTTGLHGLGIGALVPFMLGIIAAHVRAQNLPSYRFGIPLALVAGTAAIAWGPWLAHLAAMHAPGALRVDPLWALSLFGLLVAVTAIEPLERICSFPPLRLLGAASFGISLVVVPVSGFAVRQLLHAIGPYGAAANAVGASVVAGFVLWKLADRSFADGALRRDTADIIGPKCSALLALVRADRVVLGTPSVAVTPEIEPEATPFESAFYAPLPRPDATGLAVVSQRSGSPDDLAAEILAMKKRLQDRSAALFADPTPSAPAYQKPGFYRKPAPAIASATASAPDVMEHFEQRIQKRVVEATAQTHASAPTHTSPIEASVPLFDTLPAAATRDDGREEDVVLDFTPPTRSSIKMRIGAARPSTAEVGMKDERLGG